MSKCITHAFVTGTLLEEAAAKPVPHAAHGVPDPAVPEKWIFVDQQSLKLGS